MKTRRTDSQSLWKSTPDKIKNCSSLHWNSTGSEWIQLHLW
ncbi:hypothetical protein CAEBREN_21086 [Caenorhabditis brenneri]|uniref:Uncharacterized protein n=1 Tax=Caenorhabditis brenneri TaxID=135651 RepID=G0PCT0_CAEBE|nr:hypothetical protein CAEBREN_21086 [Caenorhabditis brenneri]